MKIDLTKKDMKQIADVFMKYLQHGHRSISIGVELAEYGCPECGEVIVYFWNVDNDDSDELVIRNGECE